jgi:hypothetical protein
MTIPLVPVRIPASRPWLSSMLRGDLQEAAAAAAGNGVVALQTYHDAAASYPLVAFLKAAQIPWAVEGADGALQDAFAEPGSSAETGASAEAGASPETGVREVGPAVVLYGSVLHAAAGDLLLGSFTSRMLAAAGCAPEYMGDAEPLRQHWDTVALTAWLRQNMPHGIAVVSGQGFAGIVSAYRTDAGVVESFDVLVSAGSAEALVSASETLETVAVDANAQEFGMELHFGASGLSIVAGRQTNRVPRLLVLGPSLHQGGAALQGWAALHGAGAQAEGRARVDIEVQGSAPFQHLAIRYPSASSWDGGDGRRLHEQILGALSDH